MEILQAKRIWALHQNNRKAHAQIIMWQPISVPLSTDSTTQQQRVKPRGQWHSDHLWWQQGWKAGRNGCHCNNLIVHDLVHSGFEVFSQLWNEHNSNSMEEFTIFENNRLKPGNIIIIYMATTCLPLTFVTVIGFSTSFPSAAASVHTICRWASREASDSCLSSLFWGCIGTSF